MAINIHLIRTHYPHWGQHSGINQFVKYMDHSKYNVVMQHVSDSDEDFPIHNRRVQVRLRNIVQKRGMQWYKLSDLVAEIKAFGQCCCKKVDVLHYLIGEHSAQYLPLLFKKWIKLQTKIIATFHQSPELLNSLINKDVIAKLDYVTVVSPEQVPYFRELLDPERISLILHGIDIDFFNPGSNPKDESKFKCITVGHWLRDFRAVREVAEKLAAYKDIEFQVVTSRLAGPKLTGLEDLINATLYRDTIDDPRLLNLNQKSDVLFLPLLQSTANNALLEGIACGLPVISTHLPSVKFYLPGKEAILIKDSDTKKFVDAILYLVDNPQDRTDMGREARKREEELDWRNIAPQYENLYSKLIS